MGEFTATRSLVVLGWIATAVMGAAALWSSIPAKRRPQAQWVNRSSRAVVSTLIATRIAAA